MFWEYRTPNSVTCRATSCGWLNLSSPLAGTTYAQRVAIVDHVSVGCPEPDSTTVLRWMAMRRSRRPARISVCSIQASNGRMADVVGPSDSPQTLTSLDAPQ